MVDNYMYDIKYGTEFLIGNNPEQYRSYWWNDAEPLWITATKQVSTIVDFYTPRTFRTKSHPNSRSHLFS